MLRGVRVPAALALAGWCMSGGVFGAERVPSRARPVVQIEDEEGSLHEAPPPPVVLEWNEAADPSALVTVERPVVSLLIESRTDERLLVELQARIDDGTTESRASRLAEVTVRARERTPQSVLLGAAARPVKSDGPPALLQVTATVRTARGRLVGRFHAPVLYFRPVQGSGRALIVGGEDSWRAEFAADVAGSDEPGVITDRIATWAPRRARLAVAPSDPQGPAAEARR